MSDWVPVKGYEGEYLININGDVKGIKSGGILKAAEAKNGYLVVSLWSNNKGKTHYIHRLLATHFIKPFHGETVNHKDGDKLNNKLSNLEWATYSENNLHAYSKGLRTVSSELAKKHGERLGNRNRNNSYRSIPICVYDLKDNFIGEYSSIKETAEALGISRKPIYEGLRNKVKPTMYKFKYAEAE